MKARSEDPVTAKAPLAAHPRRKHAPRPASAKVVYMSSTEAQNGFGRVLEIVGRNGRVFITRRNANQAVVISVEEYEALTGRSESPLDALTAEFDEMVAQMQTPVAKAAMRAAFRASPDELADAAVWAAQRNPA